MGLTWCQILLRNCFSNLNLDKLCAFAAFAIDENVPKNVVIDFALPGILPLCDSDNFFFVCTDLVVPNLACLTFSLCSVVNLLQFEFSYLH